MAQPDAHHLSVSPLTAHAFNADKSQVAICTNTNEVQIYQKTGPTYAPAPNVPTLSEHDKLITSIDWAPHTNRIVTCSQDRNAYVWNYEPHPQTGQYAWRPTLVLLRINRSATFVRWSPTETKFAVASGARAIAVCSYDDESNWWNAKHLKKPLRSTVTSLAWHPNGVLLAAGSTDSQARVFSAFLKGDQKPPPSVWGERLPFNTLCGEFTSGTGSWVHDVAFSPSGDLIAFASHDSTVTIVYPCGPTEPPQAIFTVRAPSLSYKSLAFLTETSLIAAGHDCQPVLFSADGGQGWEFVKSLDDPATRAAAGGTVGKIGVGPGRLNNEAFNRFKQADSKGVRNVQGEAITATGELASVHQNTITSLRIFEGTPGAVTKFTTSGVDGRLVIWTLV